MCNPYATHDEISNDLLTQKRANGRTVRHKPKSPVKCKAKKACSRKPANDGESDIPCLRMIHITTLHWNTVPGMDRKMRDALEESREKEYQKCIQEKQTGTRSTSTATPTVLQSRSKDQKSFGPVWQACVGGHTKLSKNGSQGTKCPKKVRRKRILREGYKHART